MPAMGVLFATLAAALQDPPDFSKFELIGSARGHAGRVLCVSLSGDGKILASGGEDRTLKFWEVDTGRLLGQVPRFAAFVNSCAVSRDGKLCAGTGGDRTTLIHEVESSKQVGTAKEDSFISHLQFSADGKSLLAVTGGTLVARDVSRTDRWNSLGAADWKPAQVVALSADGRYAARTAASGFLHAADVTTGETLDLTEGLEAALRVLAIDNSGKHLAFAIGSALTVRQIKKKGSKDHSVKRGHEEEITAISFHPGSKSMATGDAAGVVKIWNLDPPSARKTIAAHEGAVGQIAYSQDGKRMATCGADGLVKIWEGDALIRTIEAHESPTTGLAFGPEPEAFVSTGGDRMVRAWSLAEGRHLRSARVAHPEALHEGACIDVRPGNPPVAAFTFEAPGRKRPEEAQVRWWTAAGGESRAFELLKPDEEDIAVFSMRCGPDLIGLVCRVRRSNGSESVGARILQASTGKLLRAVEDVNAGSLDLAPDGKSAVLLGGSLKWIDLEGDGVRELQRFAGPAARRRSGRLVHFSSDGRRIVFSHDLDKINVYDLQAEKVVKTIASTSWVRSLAIGPADRHVAAGCEDGSVRIFELAGGAEVRILTGHRDAVGALAFSADGRALVSGSLELKVWGRK
jgi:WD40 repeat protein